MLDLSLLGVAVLFAGLSFVMAWIVLRLPVFCQSSWSLISVWGIASVGIAEAWLRWNTPMLAQWVIVDLCIIFLASFPGMLYLDIQQKRKRITYWERVGVPFQLKNHPVYLKDAITRIRDELEVKRPFVTRFDTEHYNDYDITKHLN
jgi:hypothetical protein